MKKEYMGKVVDINLDKGYITIGSLNKRPDFTTLAVANKMEEDSLCLGEVQKNSLVTISMKLVRLNGEGFPVGVRVGCIKRRVLSEAEQKKYHCDADGNRPEEENENTDKSAVEA